MPLRVDARNRIRRNLEQCHLGRKPRAIVIGSLTDTQLASINAKRLREQLPLIVAEVVFIGLHFYRSRAKESYSIEDMTDQIESAMSEESILIDTQYMTAMENPIAREDRYGNQINDRAVFECTQRLPRPELYSVSPKGDVIKPPGITKAVQLDGLKAFERPISG